MPTVSKVDQRKKEIGKRLRKKPKTLSEIAEEIGDGVTIKHLAVAVGRLVEEGQALRVGGRVPSYRKP